MTIYNLSALAAGAVVSFDPDLDVLNFTNPTDSAYAVRVTTSTAGVLLSLAGKTITLSGIGLGSLS